MKYLLIDARQATPRPKVAYQRRLRISVLFSIVLLLGARLNAQQPTTVQDSSIDKVMTIGSRAVLALNGAQSSGKEVRLTGTVTFTERGHAETGTIDMASLDTGMTSIVINVPSGARSETHRGLDASSLGEWQNSSDTVKQTPLHNLLIDSAWFYPEHLLLRQTRSTVELDTVQTSGASSGPQPVHLVRIVPTHNGHNRLVEHLSRMDIFLDGSSLLPAEVRFNVHPEANASIDLPVRVLYSQYESIGGHMVPMHIQRSINGVPREDIVLTKVSFDPALPSDRYLLQ